MLQKCLLLSGITKINCILVHIINAYHVDSLSSWLTLIPGYSFFFEGQLIVFLPTDKINSLKEGLHAGNVPQTLLVLQTCVTIVLHILLFFKLRQNESQVVTTFQSLLHWWSLLNQIKSFAHENHSKNTRAAEQVCRFSLRTCTADFGNNSHNMKRPKSRPASCWGHCLAWYHKATHF